MKTFVLAVVLCAGMAALAASAAETPPAYEPGLVAHYFQDPSEWGGKWPENVATPRDVGSADEWTFREYKYSRVEPVVNHLFINRGWFSIRWKGYFDPAAGDPDAAKGVPIDGQININPGNRADYEFVVTLVDGRIISKDDLTKNYAGYEGPARSVFVRPKGNGNQNDLKVNQLPYPLENGKGYDIESEAMNVKITNDKVNRNGRAMGSWWISIETDKGVILCRDKDAAAQTVGSASAGSVAGGLDGGGTDAEGVEVQFEVWADDGCRLILDGQMLVDDWRPCWEEDLGAVRRSRSIRLKDGKHRLVVEYFQGVSMANKDADPIKVYWSCPARRIVRQIVQPSQLFHTAADAASPTRD